MVVRYVNDRNPHIAFLALALLETLVTEVGYALQLQISTKWFLNELVRRFPERPPPISRASNDQDLGPNSYMERRDLRHGEAQGGLGQHSGYAPAVDIQGISI